MKKIITSTAVAVALTTAAFASGTLNVKDGTALDETVDISTELLSLGDVTVDMDTLALVYKAGIAAPSASEPGFELTFGDGITIDTAINLGIFDSETNTSVAVQTFVDADKAIIFETAAGASIVRGKDYYIGSIDQNGTSINAGALVLIVEQGTTSAGATFKVTDNTGTQELDSGAANIIATKNQFSLSVSKKLSADIDASLEFKQFYTGAGQRALWTYGDDYEIDYTNNIADLDISACVDGASFNVVATEDLEAMGVDIDWDNVTTIDLYGDTVDVNLSATEANVSANISVALSLDGATAISRTTFSLDATVDYYNCENAASNDTKTLAQGEEFGDWDVYGYSAQIPNVTGKENFETAIKFTNTGNTDADIFFTLIDPDGTEVTLNSIDYPVELVSLPAGTTGTYKATVLSALATAKDANFDTGTSYSVEVSIPSTPENIYGFASFKRKDIAQFKDLPVYNTSNNNY